MQTDREQTKETEIWPESKRKKQRANERNRDIAMNVCCHGRNEKENKIILKIVINIEIEMFGIRK